MSPLISIFADSAVGLEVIRFLIKNHSADVSSIVVNGNDSIVLKYLTDKKFDPSRIFIFSKAESDSLFSFLQQKGEINYIILAWWPYIIKERFISFPTIGVVNFHPSLLPYNRGKHYNFWTIVEECPFGVSLHMVGKGIDSGDILFQKEIVKTWEDTGETLYVKAQHAIVQLFCENYLNLINGKYLRKAQDLNSGSFHLAHELDKASIIDLEKLYTARDLINLIRARTFPSHPACRFKDETGEYEIRCSINKID